MADLKRDQVKYIRDLCKSAYEKDTKCYICEETEKLQFHHFYTMTLLWAKWKRKEKIVINTVDDILVERENFKGVHYKEIYAETITLCEFHHMQKLHKIFGKTPALHTALKQKTWCDKQRDKHLGIEDKSAPTESKWQNLKLNSRRKIVL